MLIKIILTAGFNISLLRVRMLHYILVQNILIFRRIKIRTTYTMHDMKLIGLVCRGLFASLKYVHGLPAICSKLEKIFTK